MSKKVRNKSVVLRPWMGVMLVIVLLGMLAPAMCFKSQAMEAADVNLTTNTVTEVHLQRSAGEDKELKTLARENNRKTVSSSTITIKSMTGVTEADKYITLKNISVGKKKFAIRFTVNEAYYAWFKSSNPKVAKIKSWYWKRGIAYTLLGELKGAGKTTISVTLQHISTGKKIKKKYTLTVNPGKTILESAQSKATGKITIKWKQNSSGDGYEIYRSLSRNFKDVNDRTYKIPDSKKTVATIRDLKSGAKYYIKVRSYKLVSGKPYYGAWSKVKAVKVK